jgi:hypothetical protein
MKKLFLSALFIIINGIVSWVMAPSASAQETMRVAASGQFGIASHGDSTEHQLLVLAQSEKTLSLSKTQAIRWVEQQKEQWGKTIRQTVDKGDRFAWSVDSAGHLVKLEKVARAASAPKAIQTITLQPQPLPTESDSFEGTVLKALVEQAHLSRKVAAKVVNHAAKVGGVLHDVLRGPVPQRAGDSIAFSMVNGVLVHAVIAKKGQPQAKIVDETAPPVKPAIAVVDEKKSETAHSVVETPAQEVTPKGSVEPPAQVVPTTPQTEPSTAAVIDEIIASKIILQEKETAKTETPKAEPAQGGVAIAAKLPDEVKVQGIQTPSWWSKLKNGFLEEMCAICNGSETVLNWVTTPFQKLVTAADPPPIPAKKQVRVAATPHTHQIKTAPAVASKAPAKAGFIARCWTKTKHIWNASSAWCSDTFKGAYQKVENFFSSVYDGCRDLYFFFWFHTKVFITFVLPWRRIGLDIIVALTIAGIILACCRLYRLCKKHSLKARTGNLLSSLGNRAVSLCKSGWGRFTRRGKGFLTGFRTGIRRSRMRAKAYFRLKRMEKEREERQEHASFTATVERLRVDKGVPEPDPTAAKAATERVITTHERLAHFVTMGGIGWIKEQPNLTLEEFRDFERMIADKKDRITLKENVLAYYEKQKALHEPSLATK